MTQYTVAEMQAMLTKTLMDAGLDDLCTGKAVDALVKDSYIMEVDRNARAYGWEIGRGSEIKPMIQMTDDNPFENPDWRERIA